MEGGGQGHATDLPKIWTLIFEDKDLLKYRSEDLSAKMRKMINQKNKC